MKLGISNGIVHVYTEWHGNCITKISELKLSQFMLTKETSALENRDSI